MNQSPRINSLGSIFHATCVGTLALALSNFACAQQEAPSATPFRPTVTGGANLSAPGWLELEFGGQRLGGNDVDQRNSLPYLLKYSLNDRYALLLGGEAHVNLVPAQAPRLSGAGDTTVTLKYRAPDQAEGTSLGLEATVKLPTAAPGIGSGERDYSVKGIYGIDLPGDLHLDTNLMLTRLGGVPSTQASHQWTWALALSRQFGDAWTVAGDLSGTSQGGAPSTAQFLLAASYAVNKRLVIDAGLAAGLNRNSPGFTVFSGLTVLLGKLN